MTFNFSVSNHSLSLISDFTVFSGNENYYLCKFDFLTSDWDGLSKFAVFSFDDTSLSVPIENGECLVPSEALIAGGATYIGVFGITVSDDDYRRISTGLVCMAVGEGAYREAAAPTVPEPDIWERYYAEIIKAADYTQRAENAADSAEASAAAALSDKNAAFQALSDLLKMIGSDIATLVNGKIPVSQIPSIATTEIYTAASQSEMDAVSPDNGDICIRTDENASYIYNNGWVFLVAPTDYAARSGYAETAKTAENANMINNHRLVEMSAEDFETAVIDPDTYYLVY